MSSLFIQNLLNLGLTLAGIALLMASLHLLERTAGRFLSHRLGWNALLVTAWLGVPAHELGHLVMAKLFGHRVISYRLFAPDPVSGTLGFVRHGYSRRSPWQLIGSLFIGVAPLITGGALLMALLLWMAPNRELLDLIRRLASLFREGNQGQTPESGYGVAGALAQLIWLHRTPWLPLQLYLAICLASHLSPGLADLKGALPGAIFAACLLGLTCAVLAWQRVSLAGIPVVLAPMILLVLASALFQGGYVLGVWGVLRVLRSGRGRKAAPRRCRAG